MKKIVAVNNLTLKVVEIEVETEYDNGPYISFVVKDSIDKSIILDLSVPSVNTALDMVSTLADASEKFLDMLDKSKRA